MIATTRNVAAHQVNRVHHAAPKGRFEVVATTVSVVVMALLLAVDVVRSAPADSPVVAVSFDVAPVVDATPLR